MINLTLKKKNHLKTPFKKNQFFGLYFFWIEKRVFLASNVKKGAFFALFSTIKIINTAFFETRRIFIVKLPKDIHFLS